MILEEFVIVGQKKMIELLFIIRKMKGYLQQEILVSKELEESF